MRFRPRTVCARQRAETFRELSRRRPFRPRCLRRERCRVALHQRIGSGSRLGRRTASRCSANVSSTHDICASRLLRRIERGQTPLWRLSGRLATPRGFGVLAAGCVAPTRYLSRSALRLLGERDRHLRIVPADIPRVQPTAGRPSLVCASLVRGSLARASLPVRAVLEGRRREHPHRSLLRHSADGRPGT